MKDHLKLFFTLLFGLHTIAFSNIESLYKEEIQNHANNWANTHYKTIQPHEKRFITELCSTIKELAVTQKHILFLNTRYIVVIKELQHAIVSHTQPAFSKNVLPKLSVSLHTLAEKKANLSKKLQEQESALANIPDDRIRTALNAVQDCAAIIISNHLYEQKDQLYSTIKTIESSLLDHAQHIMIVSALLTKVPLQSSSSMIDYYYSLLQNLTIHSYTIDNINEPIKNVVNTIFEIIDFVYTIHLDAIKELNLDNDNA